MADGHPFAAHRDHHVQKQRVGHITKGYASGGAVHGDEKEDRALFKKMYRAEEKKEGKASGGAVKQRLDRPGRARGGRTKAKGTNVNILVGHPGASPATGPGGGAGIAPAAPVPVPAPRPPMMPPPGMAPPGAGPVPQPMAPGAPGIRRHGGRSYAKGGAVKSGPAWEEGRRAGTQVQHRDGKDDGKDIGRGPVITKARGGSVGALEHPGPKGTSKHALGKLEHFGGGMPDGGVAGFPSIRMKGKPTHTAGATEHPTHGGMGPKLPGGGHGGLARIAKAHRAAKFSGKH